MFIPPGLDIISLLLTVRDHPECSQALEWCICPLRGSESHQMWVWSPVSITHFLTHSYSMGFLVSPSQSQTLSLSSKTGLFKGTNCTRMWTPSSWSSAGHRGLHCSIALRLEEVEEATWGQKPQPSSLQSCFIFHSFPVFKHGVSCKIKIARASWNIGNYLHCPLLLHGSSSL